MKAGTRKYGERLSQINTSLPESYVRLLRVYAQRHGISMSQVMQDAIRAYLHSQSEEVAS